MAKSFPKKIKKILAETKGQLSSLYAQRLREVILFGSYARGDYTSGSDIDLLLLLDGVDDPDVERERYARTICDLSLKYDTVVWIINDIFPERLLSYPRRSSEMTLLYS